MSAFTYKADYNKGRKSWQAKYQKPFHAIRHPRARQTLFLPERLLLTGKGLFFLFFLPAASPFS